MTSKVMVIDDDADIRFIIRINLEASGYEVLECADGFSALEAIQTNRPDVIVCDIMMPGLDGYAVLEAVRSNPVTKDIPLLFLTARGGDQDIWHGWQSGADYYLTKPFDPDELIRYLKYIEEQTAELRSEDT